MIVSSDDNDEDEELLCTADPMSAATLRLHDPIDHPEYINCPPLHSIEMVMKT